VIGVAEEIRRLSDAELTRAVSEGFKTDASGNLPDAKERNSILAQDELAHIETLRQHPSFQWFQANCVERNFKESRDLLEETDLTQFTPKAVTRLLSVFQTWRKVARWLDERELEHRRLLNPKDPHLEVIRARLDLH
jgi:hypothetical protein